MQKFVVSVSAIVYKKDGSLLVTERSDKEIQGSGLLAYPGGKIDDFKIKGDKAKHDILEETVHRELLEECGVEIGELELLNNHAFKRFDGHFSLMIVFLAKFKSQKDIDLDPDEVKAIHWMRFSDIDPKRMYESVYEIYKEAEDKRQKAKGER